MRVLARPFVLFALAALCAHAGTAHARGATSAVLLATGGEPNPAVDSVMHAALEKLEVVKIVAVPGMDLQAVQLALDCVGETVPCLETVAAQSGARVVISPTLQRAADELILSVLRFDTSGGEMRRVLRRQKTEAELLDAVPQMLRELFDLRTTEAPMVEAPAEPAQQSSRALPVGPLILAGAGVAALGAGIAMGVVMNDQQSEYERMSMQVETRADAEAADHARSVGESQALAADVLLAAGGVAILGAGIWLAVELSTGDETPPTTAFAPVLGPRQLGLVWTQRGDAL
jgi:hypothetical protein